MLFILDDDLEDDDEIEDIVVEDEEIDLGIPMPKGDLEGASRELARAADVDPSHGDLALYSLIFRAMLGDYCVARPRDVQIG